MRTIDADELKELFSEVIGHITKKPEMNGNLEHMIRASAMVIQMIDDAPTVQPDTTTHDSIPAETGKNDGDGTSGDCISRRQAIDKFIDGLEEIFSDIREREVDDSVCGLCEYDGAYIGQSGDWCNECPGFDRDDCFKLSGKTRKKWTDEIIKAFPSVQPDIIRCKDCAYCDSDVVDAPYGMTKKVWWCDRLYAGANENLIVEPDDFCSWAERRQDG